MGFWNDRLNKAIDKLSKMNDDYLTMMVNFDNLKITHKEFEIRIKNEIKAFKSDVDKQIDKIKNESESNRGRILTIESDIKSIYKDSLNTVFQNILKEMIKNNGKINPDDLNKLLGNSE